jgi:hypothetical protein
LSFENQRFLVSNQVVAVGPNIIRALELVRNVGTLLCASQDCGREKTLSILRAVAE